MAEPCACAQPTAEPTCTLVAGAGINIQGGSTIEAESALAWTPFTPATTNFTLGNALNDSRYLLAGKMLKVLYAIKFGTTSTFTATQWRLGLPAGAVPFFGANAIASNHVAGLASMRDVSAGSPWFEGEAIINQNANPVQIRFGDDAVGTNALVMSTVPFTWANTDELVIRIQLEVV